MFYGLKLLLFMSSHVGHDAFRIAEKRFTGERSMSGANRREFGGLRCARLRARSSWKLLLRRAEREDRRIVALYGTEDGRITLGGKKLYANSVQPRRNSDSSRPSRLGG